MSKSLPELQLARAARTYNQNRRLQTWEVRRLCQVCNETFIGAVDDPIKSKTCDTCLDPVEIVTASKILLSENADRTGDFSGFSWALRILKRMKEVA